MGIRKPYLTFFKPVIAEIVPKSKQIHLMPQFLRYLQSDNTENGSKNTKQTRH